VDATSKDRDARSCGPKSDRRDIFIVDVRYQPEASGDLDC
jgi:hypothetical protein